jgi:hypothetical protein
LSCKIQITMGKNKYFSTKSVFGQLISLIDDSMIQKAKSLIRIGMSNILNVKIICLVWFLLRKVQFCVKLLEECLVYRVKRKQWESIIFQRALCRTQTNVEKWSFEEIYNNLLKKYSFILSDSRIQIALGKNIKIVDKPV